MTLTDDLEIWGQTSFNLTFNNKTCYYNAEFDRGVYCDYSEVKDLRKTEINHLTVTVDLENYTVINIYFMTFRISGCIYSKDKISVSTPTFSRSRILKKKQINYLTATVDLERQDQTHLYDLSYLGLHTWYILDFGVNSN